MSVADLTRRIEALEKALDKTQGHVADLRIWQGWTTGFWFGLGALSTLTVAGAVWKLLQ